MQTIAIVIPCYKDHERISTTLASIDEAVSGLRSYSFHIVLIDDGSEQLKVEHFEKRSFPIHILTHPINRGQGAALETGFSYCRYFIDATYVITMDADGQHSGNDIPHLIKTIEDDGSDIVFGNRFKKSPSMPHSRRIILKCAARFEKWLTKLELQDAHNGFRIFNRKTLEILKLKQDRMAHATEIKQLVAKNKLKYSEMPVTIKYSKDHIEKGQKNSGSLLILRDLIKSYIFENR